MPSPLWHLLQNGMTAGELLAIFGTSRDGSESFDMGGGGGGRERATWLALRNPVFARLWLASVLSGTFVSAQDVAATWLMHGLGASSFALSLMATAAAAPFFLLTLPAGAVADIANRRVVIISAVFWQGGCSALLALGAWTRVIDANSVLACIFALGIGLAFYAPVWGAIVPDIVDKEELPSAITLGGVQLNLSGIVGPALGGLLLPILGAPWLITANALMFAVVALAVAQWKPRQEQATMLRENFTESFISSLRYARHSPRMKTVLLRDLIFALVISIIPALLPVVALKELHLSATHLGLCVCVCGRRFAGGSGFPPSLPEATCLVQRHHLDFHDHPGHGASDAGPGAGIAGSFGLCHVSRCRLGRWRGRSFGWLASASCPAGCEDG